MVSELLHSFLEYDDAVKDEKWAEEKTRIIMLNSIPIMSKVDYDAGENILYGRFPQVDVNKIFVGKAMETYRTKLSNSSVFLFENSRNAMIDDRISAGLRCYVNSLDPEKEEKRKSDKELLRNRKGIEALMNDITGNNGMPQSKIGGDDFEGNVDQFDEEGGDDMDEDSVESFFETSWGLKQEIELQKPLQAVINTNQVQRNFDKYINSILISLHTCSQVYVNEMTGALEIEHLYPYQVEVLNATGSNDYKDSQAFRIIKVNNVSGFLKEFGAHFDIYNDWPLLLASSRGTNQNNGNIGNAGNSVYSGITDQYDNILFGNRNAGTINFKDVLDMPIEYEYAEWKSITKVNRQHVVTPNGNIVPRVWDKNNPPIDGASTSVKTFEDTYHAYYLRVGANTPKLIKWGKVYAQNIEGFNDEYSGFTIKVNKRDGAPMAEILRPFWQLMNVSFKMFEMLVNDIKPDGHFFNYTSLMKIVSFLQTTKDAPTDARNAIDDFLKMVQESPNALTDNVETDEGQQLGGGNMAITPKKNGLNAAAPELMKIIDWIEIKVQKYTATEGLTPQTDGFKLSLENKRRSRQATAFIDYIMLAHLEDICISILNYTKDISKFKDIPAYKYMENLVGYKCMDFIASMKKAPHRYGTFIDTFNNDIELLEMKQLVMEEYQKQAIPLEDAIMVRSVDNIKQALKYLAIQKRKAAKQKQKDAMGLLAQQDANAEKEHKRKMDLENLIGAWKAKTAGANSAGFVNAAQINAKAQLAKTQMTVQGENERVVAEADAEIDKLTKEYNLQQQQAPAV